MSEKLMKIFLITVAATLLSIPLSGQVGDRRALVIGNDTYQRAHTLLNARNDARDVAAVLNDLDYSVTVGLDRTRAQMQNDIDLFAQNLAPGDVAIVYYSGHGFQAEGENYLVPIDFDANSEPTGREQAIPLSQIINIVSSRGARIQIIILDACRDNPFFATRSAKTGWAETGISNGIVLAFGTAPGSTSSDNPAGRNGLFTKALLNHISSNLSVEDMLKAVRHETILASAGTQTPWIASSLVGEFSIRSQSGITKEVSLSEQLNRSASSSVDLNSGPKSAKSVLSREAQSAVDIRSADILVRQGLLLANQGNYDEATRSLSAALAVHPGYSVALRVLGVIFHLIGKSAEAAAQFTRAIEADPTDALAYTYRCAETTKSDPNGAIRDCYTAAAISPKLPSIHLILSNALLEAGRTDAAIQEANKAIQLEPQSVTGYALRAKIYRSIGNYSASERDIHTAIQFSTSTQRH